MVFTIILLDAFCFLPRNRFSNTQR